MITMVLQRRGRDERSLKIKSVSKRSAKTIDEADQTRRVNSSQTSFTRVFVLVACLSDHFFSQVIPCDTFFGLCKTSRLAKTTQVADSKSIKETHQKAQLFITKDKHRH